MHPDFSAAKIEKSAQIAQANTVFPQFAFVLPRKNQSSFLLLCSVFYSIIESECVSVVIR